MYTFYKYILNFLIVIYWICFKTASTLTHPSDITIEIWANVSEQRPEFDRIRHWHSGKDSSLTNRPSTTGFSSNLVIKRFLLLSLQNFLRPKINWYFYAEESRNLADFDKDGKLTYEEFILAMHLCDYAKTGATLPQSLPADLHPTPRSRSSSLLSQVPGATVLG